MAKIQTIEEIHAAYRIKRDGIDCAFDQLRMQLDTEYKTRRAELDAELDAAIEEIDSRRKPKGRKPKSI